MGNHRIEKLESWALSAKNEEISIYASSKLSKLQLPYLFVGGVHGDEPEGVVLAENLLAYLSHTAVKKDWALITCINPDGYRAHSRTNGRLVDLNRNFPSSDWVNFSKEKRYYPGPQPGSEPEVQALVQLIKDIQPIVVFHFHSWKPEIIVTGPEDLPEAQIFSQLSKYPLKSDIGYPTPGSLGQYVWHDLNTPVICIEEKEKVCPVESWQRFKPAFEEILEPAPLGMSS